MIGTSKRFLTKFVAYALLLVLLFNGGMDVLVPKAKAAEALDELQRNSIAMLNYLTVLTQEINASKNSRLYLEGAYSSLVNNIYPNAVDPQTLEQLTMMLDTLENYRMLSVHRDRYQYIYEQNLAGAVKEAMPKPLNVLSYTSAKSLPQAAMALVNLAIDAAVSYTSYLEEIEQQNIQSVWELDDQEAEQLHQSRKQAFDYMIRMVNQYDIQGDLALNENAVKEFVAMKNNSNIAQKIQYLLSNKSTFQWFGDYWLVLAESFYRNQDYKECLDAIATYESMSARIFRKDYELAKVLAFGIAAAEQTQVAVEYEGTAKRFGELILTNTDNKDWALRFFVAQTYVDLYAKNKDTKLLEDAFRIVLDNVNLLVSKQKELNREYLADVKQAKPQGDATNRQKDEVANYNKQMREERKRALAPIYEPLVVNCDMMMFLVDELKVSDADKMKIESILHENGEALFLVPAVDAQYYFSGETKAQQSQVYEVEFNGKELTIPAYLVARNAKIKMTVKTQDGHEVASFEDWTIQSVNRDAKKPFETFTVTFKNASAEQFKYEPDQKVDITINPKADAQLEPLQLSFITEKRKENWWEVVKVWEGDIGFVRQQE